MLKLTSSHQSFSNQYKCCHPGVCTNKCRKVATLLLNLLDMGLSEFCSWWALFLVCTVHVADGTHSPRRLSPLTLLPFHLRSWTFGQMAKCVMFWEDCSGWKSQIGTVHDPASFGLLAQYAASWATLTQSSSHISGVLHGLLHGQVFPRHTLLTCFLTHSQKYTSKASGERWTWWKALQRWGGT